MHLPQLRLDQEASIQSVGQRPVQAYLGHQVGLVVDPIRHLRDHQEGCHAAYGGFLEMPLSLERRLDRETSAQFIKDVGQKMTPGLRQMSL